MYSVSILHMRFVEKKNRNFLSLLHYLSQSAIVKWSMYVTWCAKLANAIRFMKLQWTLHRKRGAIVKSIKIWVMVLWLDQLLHYIFQLLYYMEIKNQRLHVKCIVVGFAARAGGKFSIGGTFLGAKSLWHWLHQRNDSV